MGLDDTGPQQEPARTAAWLYFSRTASLMFDIQTSFMMTLRFFPSRRIEIQFKTSCHLRGLYGLRAGGVDTTFGHQEIHDAPHHVIVGAANQRRRLPLLTDQADG